MLCTLTTEYSTNQVGNVLIGTQSCNQTSPKDASLLKVSCQCNDDDDVCMPLILLSVLVPLLRFERRCPIGHRPSTCCVYQFHHRGITDKSIRPTVDKVKIDKLRPIGMTGEWQIATRHTYDRRRVSMAGTASKRAKPKGRPMMVMHKA